MKKYILFLFVVYAFNLFGQVNFNYYGKLDSKEVKKLNNVRKVKGTKGFVESGWYEPTYSLLDFYYSGGENMYKEYVNILFPDSTVNVESGGKVYSNFDIAIGYVFDPYAEIFLGSENIDPIINKFNSYRIDSIYVIGFYSIKNFNVDSPDTLVAEIVFNKPNKSPAFGEAWWWKDYPDMKFCSPKFYGSKEEFGYKARLTSPAKIVRKYVLTVEDSSRVIISFPVGGIEIPVGNIVGVSLTFVPGYKYNKGDLLFSYSERDKGQYNAFRYYLMVANNDNPIFFDVNSKNLSYMINKWQRYIAYKDNILNTNMWPLIDWGLHFGFYLSISDNLNIKNNYAVNSKIYPNPATEYFYLELGQPAQIEITNIEGRVVFSSLLNEKTNKVDISNLPKGNYIVKVFNEKHFDTHKLVIY